MNKLIERLENTPVFIVQAYSKDGHKIPFAVYDTDYVRNERVDMGHIIKALKAADRMATFGTRHEAYCRWVDGFDCNCGADEALTAYRNLTQETPHAG